MSHNILAGKRGIIFGALDDQSIAWKTAESVKNEGFEYYDVKFDTEGLKVWETDYS